MKNLRRASQGLFLLSFLFLFLQTESKGADDLGYPVKLFLDFDPLIMITTALSAHTLQSAFYFSLIVIAATVIFGRVFCGWVCPLGTLHNIVGAVRRRAGRVRDIGWYRVKYFILLFLISSSLVTMQLTGIVDPLSLLIRSFSLSMYPLFSYGVSAVFDAVYEGGTGPVVSASESVYTFLKKSVLPFQQPHFRQAAFLGVLFFTVLGLNFVEKRFWCRNLCPLGALLGVLSRYSLLRRSVSEGCNECGTCSRECQGSASPDIKGKWKPSECMYCWNCDDICPQNAVSFGFMRKGTTGGLDLGRRRVLVSVAGGFLTVPLIRVEPLVSTAGASEQLIRPPGAVDESEFLKRCVKCGECMKVCITNGLQPALLESGLEGLWSPLLVPRLGYCEFRCTLCGQVCPTGAIRKLDLKEKMATRIGLAMIDRSRCLPYAQARPCIVCEEVCPTPKKAIWFERHMVKDRDGNELLLQQPRVDPELCVGCGICEAKCPVSSSPAIYVISTGESRSKTNQLLL